MELEGQELEEEAESLDQIFSNVKVLIENPTKNEGLFFSLMLQASESAFLVDYVNTQADVQNSFLKLIMKVNLLINSIIKDQSSDCWMNLCKLNLKTI